MRTDSHPDRVVVVVVVMRKVPQQAAPEVSGALIIQAGMSGDDMVWTLRTCVLPSQ